jgi:hypothetical protein
MAIAITCSCSAQLEVDEKFAGQSITCPDCQKSLQVPNPSSGAAQRTSALALVSLILALVGAVTILGTLLAVACGLVALWQIRRQPDRLAGSTYALAGIVVGVVMTGFSLFAYLAPNLTVVDPVMRQYRWLGKLDYSGPLELKYEREGFAITRPSPDWGVLNTSGNIKIGEPLRDFLMANPAKTALVLVLPQKVAPSLLLDDCKAKGEKLFRDVELNGAFLQRGVPRGVEMTYHKTGNRKLNPPKDGPFAGWELTVDKTTQGQTRTYLLRILRRDKDDMMYVVAGGADKARFAAVADELRTALDSFRPIDRAPGGDGLLRGLGE